VTASPVRELHGSADAIVTGLDAMIDDDDFAMLPEAARRYLRFMRISGRPRDRSVSVEWSGRFRRAPHEAWHACHAWQRTTAAEIARSFQMRMEIAPFVWIVARDTYAAGRGRLNVRLFDWVTVMDATGPELDLGELVTWLNDAVLFAPSMLLHHAVHWSAVDRHAFDLAVTDAGLTARARVIVDQAGAPRDFVTSDRFLQDPDLPGHPWRRTPWSTPIAGWSVTGGRPRPSGGQAVWRLAGGDFAYAIMDMGAARVIYDATPEGSVR